MAPIHIPVLTREEYGELLDRVVKDLSTRMRIEHVADPADRDRLLANLQGLALVEAEKLLTRAIVEDGRLDADDVKRIAEAKRDLVERDGLLEYCPTAESLSRDRRPRAAQGVAREAAPVHGRPAAGRRSSASNSRGACCSWACPAAARASAPKP